MYSLVAFSTFIRLNNHHHFLHSEDFHDPKKETTHTETVILHSPSSDPGNH